MVCICKPSSGEEEVQTLLGLVQVACSEIRPVARGKVNNTRGTLSEAVLWPACTHTCAPGHKMCTCTHTYAYVTAFMCG